MAITQATKYCTEIKISEVSKLESTFTPEVSIHGIPWNVKLCKVGQGAEQKLCAYLFCKNKDKSPNWSLWGSASFKLLPFSDDANPVEFHVSPYTFNVNGFGRGTSSLIKWNDLFNQDKKFVKNDAITLEMKIAAENPNDPNRSRLNFECLHKCCDNCHFAKFRLTVTNSMNLMAVQSPNFSLRGIPWNLQITKMRSSHLGVLLRLNKNSGNVSTKMTMTIKLVSSKDDVQAIAKCVTKQYQYLKNHTTFEIISWDELVKSENGFVNNNSITLNIEIDEENSNGGAELKPKAEAKLLQMECAICLESLDGQDISATPCGHLFCLACITKVVEDLAICPTCKTPVQLDALRQLYLPTVN